MKIQIEFKNKVYTITYGKLKASAPTVKGAIDILVEVFKKETEAKVLGFRQELEKFFIH